jgi:transcriptional regulator with XRE-family HTH domain
MVKKKYTKKVIVNDEHASAEARAGRLRKIRNLANLSRKEICDKEEINFNTYKGWELARFGGLPVDGAEKVIKRVAKENVICSIDWLLYGRGQEPYLLPRSTSLNDLNDLNAHTLILKEILLFQSFHLDAIYTQIQDDALAPQFMPGDYVAGIKMVHSNIVKAVNQPCIIELANGDIAVRYLKQGQNIGEFQLLATNIDSSIGFNFSIESELKSAAPIIRHYKNPTF